MKTRMCQWHPMSELTHYCEETICEQAVLCADCLMRSHQYHRVVPIKGICEARLRHLKVLKQAIGQNHQLLQSARKKVENNRCDILNKVKTQMTEYYVALNQLEKKIISDTNSKALSVQRKLSSREGILKEAESQLKALETELADTVPNIVQANVSKHMDRDSNRLHDTLKNWDLKYRLLHICGDVLNLNKFAYIHMNIDTIIEMPEVAVKGAPVGLFRSLVSPAEAKEIVTWKQRDDDVRDMVCHSDGGGGVTILSSSHIRAYKQNGKMFR